jgi:hypothetical protein
MHLSIHLDHLSCLVHPKTKTFLRLHGGEELKSSDFFWAHRSVRSAIRRYPSACVGLVEYWWPGLFQGDKAAVAGPRSSLVRVRVPSSPVPTIKRCTLRALPFVHSPMISPDFSPLSTVPSPPKSLTPQGTDTWAKAHSWSHKSAMENLYVRVREA